MADVFAYLYGFGAGGDITKSVIIVTAPTGSTVTCTKGTIVKTTTEKNGEWWFKNLDTGKWTLKATLSGQTATQIFNITQFGVYRISMSYFKATIKVTYPSGSTCTCSKNGKTFTAPNTSGSYTFTVDSTGTWIVSCTDGRNTKSLAISISSNGESKAATLVYEQYLYNNGDEFSSITGGWVISKAWGSSYAGNGTLYKDSSTLRVVLPSNASDFLRTSEKIDLTPYSKISFKYKKNSTGTHVHLCAATGITEGQWGLTTLVATSDFTDNSGEFSIDISKINRSCYVGVGMDIGYGSSEDSIIIYNIRLE